MTKFDHRSGLPEGFLEVPATGIHELLPGPTLIDLPGERDDTLFLSVLQHGNEDTGLRAIQRLLRAWQGRRLPRALSLFVANPAAARDRRRRLDGQPDFNRCWPGTELEPNEVSTMLAEVVRTVQERALFANVDIHNTSGASPVYACVNTLDTACLQLAARFSRTIVFFTRPRGLQAQAFLGLCPSVVLECGQVGDESGVEAAHRYLETLLHLDAVPHEPPEPGSLVLLRSLGLVQIPHGVRFSIGEEDPESELILDPAIDRLNFRQVPAGTAFGQARGRRFPVRMIAPGGEDVTGDYFEVSEGMLRLRRSTMPSLLTRDPRIVRQDCLCHLMEAFDPVDRDR